MEEIWDSELTKNSIKRYTRQIIVPNIGINEQKRIENTKILIVGLGGLGSPVLAYIGMSGVKEIGIIDFDYVELHNLQRQLIHTEDRIGISKVKSAIKFIKGLNSSIKIKSYEIKMDEMNCRNIILEYNLIIDCCDQIGLRYMIADVCREYKKDLVNGSVLRWGGQICVFPSGGKCFRCLFPNMKNEGRNCDENGVIGSMCGVIGSMQATEAIKLIVNEVNKAKMIIFNGYNNSYKCFEINTKPCKYCLELLKMNDNKINEEFNYKNDRFNEKNKEYKNNIIKQKKNDNTNDIIKWSYILKNKKQFKIYDIRNELHFKMFRFKNSINIPNNADSIIQAGSETIVITCYQGISSEKIVILLKKRGIKAFSAENGIEGLKREINF